MGRRLARIVVLLAGAAMLAGCVEMAPRSSVAFQPAAEREARYAAEVALAVKENRRDEISEAAANGRLIRPQMPEVWASSPGAAPLGPEGTPERSVLPALGSAAADSELGPPPACAGPGSPAAARSIDCEGPWPGAGPGLTALFPAAIAPAKRPRR
jgi:hypothetical protein